MTRSAPYDKSKCLGSWGSMVARLKLKEIDGRAPPGVNSLQHAAVALLHIAARRGFGGRSWRMPNANASLLSRKATPSNCGKPLKRSLQSRRPKGGGGQVNSLGYWNNVSDATMSDPQPSSYGPAGYGEGSETRWGWVGNSVSRPQRRARLGPA